MAGANSVAGFGVEAIGNVLREERRWRDTSGIAMRIEKPLHELLSCAARIIDLVGATGGAKLVALHLSQQVSKWKSLRFREA